MVMAAPERITIEKKSWLGYVAAFILHTYVAYTCAMHLSEWLVFHWFGWVMPIMHVFTGIPATDWYLQHFALMTIVPALLELGAGFSFVARQKRIQLDGERLLHRPLVLQPQTQTAGRGGTEAGQFQA
jgi:hypothetical protein